MTVKEISSTEEIEELLRLNKVKAKWMAEAIRKVLRIGKINKVYTSTTGNDPLTFIDSVLTQLKIQYECPEEDLKNIPVTGPFIVVSNHPYGGIDGLILMKLFLDKRPDFRMMMNYMLHQFPEIAPASIAVNPFDGSAKTGMNVKGLKKALNMLQAGNPIGFFPAGEVSSFHLNKMRIADKRWHPVTGKLISKAEVRVVPVYFSGHNSFFFHLLGMVNPHLRTIRLPSELFNKKQKIMVRIGKPVPYETLSMFDDADQMMRFLRAKTYSLGTALEVKPYYLMKDRVVRPVETIIEETKTSVLKKEVLQLKEDGGELAAYKEFSVCVADATQIPNILREISRLREITFREVGEGTGKSCDTDEYDLYYKHLFLWDNNEHRIAGAYRIGEGPFLFSRFRKKGFYLNELFRFTNGFSPIFKSSLELGRSFVIKEYQRSPYPLMLLWKGINEMVKRTKGCEYLIGPVSISNQFTGLSKDLLVHYIRRNHFDKDLAACVTPRKKYHYMAKGEAKGLKDTPIDDLRFVEQLISDIEPQRNKIPVLVKKYISQNAKIIAFNVDPDFNHSLDGLVVLRLKDVPASTFKMVE